jgi:hypothetical protein
MSEFSRKKAFSPGKESELMEKAVTEIHNLFGCRSLIAKILKRRNLE